MRNVFLLITHLCVFFSIPAFATNADEEQDLLVIGVVQRPITLDPTRAYTSFDIQISPALFETLLILGDDGQTLEPGVAESWDVSDDGLIYTFHLRKDARWSDGQAVVADHFIAGWFRALMPDSRATLATLHDLIANAVELRERRQASLDNWAQLNELPRRESFADWKALRNEYAESVWSEGDHTLKVRLRRPVSYFPYLVTNSVFAPLPGEVVEHDFDLFLDAERGMWIPAASFVNPDEIVFNGPYRLVEPAEREGEIVLTKNDQYWAQRGTGFTRVHVKRFEDQEALVEAYEKRVVDWVPSVLSSEDVDRMVLDKRKDVHRVPHVGTYYYEFNCRPTINDKPNPFSDPKLRRAIAHLFDRETMVQVAPTFHGPLLTFIPPETIPGYVPPVDSAAAFDVQKAKQLLKEAGYADPSGIGPLVLMINKESRHVAMAEPTIKRLKAVGFDVQLETPTFRVCLDRARTGDFHLRRSGWYADIHDPSSFLDLYAPWVQTDSGYQSDASREAYLAAVREGDKEKHLMLMQRAESILLEEAPCIPVSQYHGVSLYRPTDLRLTGHAWGFCRLDRIRKVNQGLAIDRD